MHKNKKLKISIIGAGRMGGRWAQIISGFPGVNLKIIVDTDLSKAEQASGNLGGVLASKNYKDALKPDIDAVMVVTPHKYLYPLARAALIAGKHVFVEKPGGKTAREMKSLIRLAEQKGLALFVGFNYRFFDAICRAKKIVSAGEIGKVNFIRIKHGHPGRTGYEKEWRMDKRIAGGGVLMDQGLHVIDLANWFLGEPVKKVFGLTGNFFWKSGVEDNAFSLLKTRSGKIASIAVGITEWKPVFFLEVFGSKGYCIVDGLGKKYGGGEKLTIGRYNHKAQKLKEKIIICNPDYDGALRREFAEFVLSIGKKKNLSAGAKDAFEVLKIIEVVYGKN